MRVDRSTKPIPNLQQKDLCAVGHQEPTRDRAQGIRRTDQVTLSSRAREIKQLFQALATTPPERVERVAALRRAVESGTYRIPEEELADLLVGVVYA
jgi:flagellar biosynthesis anti-sigma factor FlgM